MSIAGLLFFILPMALIAGAIKLTSQGPVFFRQARPGKMGKSFILSKFRTMREKKGTYWSDSERLTFLGKWLRRWSLDELPELANVLKGEMSIVGPRPLLMEYLGRYTAEQARRHDVKPGITGWAQVNGRNAISWEEKFRYDLWYVDNWNLGLDLKILALTLIKVLKGEGVSQSGQATMKEFKGGLIDK